ncbi:MAG: hypothetical protein INR71_00610 [Terriglobus roseus]|nr:hypothetical protein [Terriglobus roseus]
MRYNAIDKETGQIKRLEPQIMAIGATATPPDDVKFQWQPRIRCNDCPGKLYNVGPGMSADNFKTHLTNRKHREAVETRLARAR